MQVPPLAPAAHAFREDLIERAVEAAANAAERHLLTLAGTSLTLDFGTTELAQALLPALSHHVVAGSPLQDLKPALQPAGVRLIVWSDPLPPFPWGGQHLGRGGAITGLSDGPVRAVATTDDSSLVLWDEHRQLACCWFAAPSSVTRWDRAAPLRVALHFALTQAHRHLVHGAVVGQGGRGVLLAGPGGSGKSTTTLACLDAGLDVVGDDYAVVDLRDEAPRAWNLYRSLKVGERRADRDDRRTLLLGADRPQQATMYLDLVAILLPRVTGGARSTLQPASRAAALRALAPSTLMQAPYEERPTLGALTALAQALPAWELGLGEDRGVGAITEVLAA
ncbi:MAG: hypothetical protein JHD16_04480 [Solirubrobacteraceae bacterium]|nr:hypothetical protein [Solirubrobacteraceae bacterium]